MMSELQNEIVNDKKMADAIRVLAMDAVENAQSGHPGAPMGMADIATVLFTKFMQFDPQNPEWANRDRFVLSAGHGSMLLYALGYLLGYPEMTMQEIQNFRTLGSLTPGHPELDRKIGIETTTGPLGQGLGNAVGMALAERILAEEFGSELYDHYTYVLAGDGCLMEGISHEAISFAGHLKLGKLILFFDDNQVSIDGPTSLSVSDDQVKRFEASQWHVQSIDGHDHQAIEAAIIAAQQDERPSMIACRTTIGFGSPNKSGKSSSHGAPMGAEEGNLVRETLGWDDDPFEIDDSLLNAWRACGENGHKSFLEWQQKYEHSPNALKDELERRISGKLPENWQSALNKYKKSLVADKPKWATRKSSGNTLEVLLAEIPELLGGSADLTGSNNTKASVSIPISKRNWQGNYIHYGIREHGMAAIMNGIAVHGGLIPYGGTFLTFTDYCKPSIRLAAMMKQRVIFVMTHDSIGLGEDGPTHQPIEHLASLRSIPDLNVYRPADAIEVAECWESALQSQETPSVIVLSRQGLPLLREDHEESILSAKGAYKLRGNHADEQAVVTLIATGSEVQIALETHEKLKEYGIISEVVSMPCWELFEKQSDTYRADILPKHTLKVAIEAAASFGWERHIGLDGIFVGMNGYGASAPCNELYKHFNITAEYAVEKIMERLG